MLDLFVRAELNLGHVLDLHLFEVKGEVVKKSNLHLFGIKGEVITKGNHHHALQSYLRTIPTQSFSLVW